MLWTKLICFAHEYAAYALLPTLLVLHTHWIYQLHLQYVFAAMAIVFFCGVLYTLQDRLLFHPSMPPNSTFYVPFPTLLSYETVEVPTSDGEKLRGFFIKSSIGDPVKAPTIIFFHGNAGLKSCAKLRNRCKQEVPRLGNVGSPACHPIPKLCGANVLTVDYRGYGKSTGWPTERGLYLDGHACVEYALSRSDVDPNKIVVMGHSMGGAVAIHLAATADEYGQKISAVIIENTFTSLPHAAGHIFRNITSKLGNLPLSFYSNKFQSLEKISRIRIPILFICGDSDEIVDPRMTRALFESCDSAHKIMLTVTNGKHNDTWCSSNQYHMFISSFLSKAFNGSIANGDDVTSDIPWGTQYKT